MSLKNEQATLVPYSMLATKHDKRKAGPPTSRPFLITTNDRLRGGDFQPRRDTCPHPTITTPNVPRTLDRDSIDCQTEGEFYFRRLKIQFSDETPKNR